MPPDLATDLHRLIQTLQTWVNGQPSDWWLYANTIVLFFTLVALAFYTWETRKLRKATETQTERAGLLLEAANRQNQSAQEQNDISIQPMLAVYVAPANQIDHVFLVNVGKGPAFNVSIKNPPDPLLKISSVPSVMSGGYSQTLKITYSTQVLLAQSLCKKLEEGEIQDPLVLVVHCVGLNHTPHEFVFRCTPIEGRLDITYRKDGYLATLPK